MANTVISVENVSKQYHLGVIGTGTFRNDLMLWWAKTRNKPNPLALVDEADHGNRDGETLWALKDVSFKVEQGEALGIIGRNGAGKSTLLKILSRVTAPTSGEVKVKGRIASLLEVGTGFHPELTGRENIFLNGAIMGMSRAEVTRKFDEIVDFSGVEKFIDTPVKRYSSGMYVRLAFAVAAHLEPEILIVDEVLAVGDAEFQKKCLGKMGDVTHEGRTVLFVSHNLQMIKILCKQGLVLGSGKKVFLGSAETACSYYLSSFASNKQDNLVFKPGKIYISNIDIEVTPNNTDFYKDIVLKFKLVSDVLINQVSLGFSIHDEMGNTKLINYSGPKTLFSLDKGIFEISAKISNFSLTPGKYTVRARLESKTKTLDWPSGDLGEIVIEMPKDLYGFRSETLTNGQLFLLPTWKLTKIQG